MSPRLRPVVAAGFVGALLTGAGSSLYFWHGVWHGATSSGVSVTCSEPRLWPEGRPECNAPVRLCPDGEACEVEPRLWSQNQHALPPA